MRTRCSSEKAPLFVLSVCDANSLSGRMCMTVELYRTADNSSQFYECAPLAREEVVEYNLTDKYLGVWNLRDCPENFDFDVSRQKCIERKTMRRQQAACAKNPASTGCQAPCSGAASIPTIGSPCDWKEAALHPDPKSNAYFVQCSPQSAGTPCGEWTRMACAPNTVFSKPSSICVSMSVQSSACGSQREPVCNCAKTAGATQCPGTSTCNKNVCCQQKDVIDNFIQHQAPYSACVQGLGCCPVPVNQPKEAIQITLCPGSFSPPLGSCGSCPTGTSCSPAINACCPFATKSPPDLTFNVVQLCPNGSPALQSCSRGCPDGYSCYQGSCCPMSCPVGQTALGFCSSGACSGGGSCYTPGGCCCQETVKLPVCANGMWATYGMLEWRMLSDAILSHRGTSPNALWKQQYDLRFGTFMSGRALLSFTSLSKRNNLIRCSNGCANCCPFGHSCVNGGCCPLPQCPAGGLALTMCGTRSCSVGNECVGGGCCPLPRCPSGLQATQRCQRGIGCPRGHQCENGVCCAMPTCSAGLIAASVCGMGNSCPMGFVCEVHPQKFILPQHYKFNNVDAQRGECEEVVAKNRLHFAQMEAELFNGAVEELNALQDLDVLLSEDVAFYRWNQCAQHKRTQSANVLPIVLAHRVQRAQWERVVPKMPAKVLTLARNGCDQYGSPCTVLLSTARRKPIIAPVGNITDAPLFFNVATERRCVVNATDVNFDPDSTCLPNEKCINGECRMKLWPGEYGCITDDECTSRCPNTYCEKKKSDKNVAQCQCRDGQLLFGRCFSQCPPGFHESGAYCMHDDEDAFWADGDAQDRIKALLNASPC
ncbi:EB module [Necator americanus]|uniref:EB module n=1 Tax=Necator americanus TaxID=51031 RepID=W2SJI9_NECAM|nr:EB module [Necator americanus]ETN69056.1 EB module [Necator americanus]